MYLKQTEIYPFYISFLSPLESMRPPSALPFLNCFFADAGPALRDFHGFLIQSYYVLHTSPSVAYLSLYGLASSLPRTSESKMELTEGNVSAEDFLNIIV